MSDYTHAYLYWSSKMHCSESLLSCGWLVESKQQKTDRCVICKLADESRNQAPPSLGICRMSFTGEARMSSTPPASTRIKHGGWDRL